MGLLRTTRPSAACQFSFACSSRSLVALLSIFLLRRSFSAAFLSFSASFAALRAAFSSAFLAASSASFFLCAAFSASFLLCAASSLAFAAASSASFFCRLASSASFFSCSTSLLAALRAFLSACGSSSASRLVFSSRCFCFASFSHRCWWVALALFPSSFIILSEYFLS